ncbi:hypothetical protein LCGC14_1992610, partial [marine sediment metagenome]
MGPLAFSRKKSEDYPLCLQQDKTRVKQGDVCSRCNAWRGSLGLEPTPDLYLEHMVTVFREVRRVLR